MAQHPRHAWSPSRFAALFALFGIVLLITGCRTIYPRTPIGTGTYSYLNGELSWTYPVALEELKAATLAALTELRLPVHTQRIDGFGGTIEAVRGEQITVRLRLQPESEKTTRLRVRFGRLGNRQESERIHAAVRQQLGL
jgi:Protein of unknown function (DUF3568)